MLQEAEERAAMANRTFIPGHGITVAADEIFDGNQPHFVMVEPGSLRMVELSRQDKRDALTWGVTILSCAQEGVTIEQVVSDGATGFHPVR